MKGNIGITTKKFIADDIKTQQQMMNFMDIAKQFQIDKVLPKALDQKLPYETVEPSNGFHISIGKDDCIDELS